MQDILRGFTRRTRARPRKLCLNSLCSVQEAKPASVAISGSECTAFMTERLKGRKYERREKGGKRMEGD
jgi:hypothetical protein